MSLYLPDSSTMPVSPYQPLSFPASPSQPLSSPALPAPPSPRVCVLLGRADGDGGWGVHIEGHSTMFGSVLSYVSLRILGVPLDNPLAVQGRRWILEHGSATHITSWGKFWLCVRLQNSPQVLSALGALAEWEG